MNWCGLAVHHSSDLETGLKPCGKFGSGDVVFVDYPCSFTSRATLRAVASEIMIGVKFAVRADLRGVVGANVGMVLKIDLGMIVLLSHPFYFHPTKTVLSIVLGLPPL